MVILAHGCQHGTCLESRQLPRLTRGRVRSDATDHRAEPLHEASGGRRVAHASRLAKDSIRACRDAASGCRAAAQVRHALQAQTFRDGAETLASGGEEPAQEVALAELLQPRLPLIDAAAEAVEDLGHCTRQGGLPLPEAADMVPPLSRAVDPLADPM
jgi:hypothetical protein